MAPNDKTLTDMTQARIVATLIDEDGQLFSEVAGATIARDVPQQWFHWLLTALLCSARINGTNAMQAAAGLKAEGLHTVEAILDAPRAQRIRVLNRNGYARFDNVGADSIHAAARRVQDLYGGDLRRLRAAAEGDATRVTALLKEFTGIGATGAAIFCREAQMVWEELFPMADARCLKQARALGLPEDAVALARLAGGTERYVRLLSALTRTSLTGTKSAQANSTRASTKDASGAARAASGHDG